MSPTDPRVLTVEETAVRLRCSTRQVFKFLKAGRLKRGRRSGRAAVVTVSSIEAYETVPAPTPVPRSRPLAHEIPLVRSRSHSSPTPLTWDEVR